MPCYVLHKALHGLAPGCLCCPQPGPKASPKQPCQAHLQPHHRVGFLAFCFRLGEVFPDCPVSASALCFHYGADHNVIYLFSWVFHCPLKSYMSPIGAGPSPSYIPRNWAVPGPVGSLEIYKVNEKKFFDCGINE